MINLLYELWSCFVEALAFVWAQTCWVYGHDDMVLDKSLNTFRCRVCRRIEKREED